MQTQDRVLARGALAVIALLLLVVSAENAGAQDVAALKSEVTRLSERYEYLTDWLQFLGVVIGLLGVVSVVGFGLWTFGEFRAQKSINTINELYQLAERSARHSEGATLQQAWDWLEDVDASARKFLDNKDHRNIIRSHVAKNQLKKISGDIRAYETFLRQAWGRRASKRVDKAYLPPPLTPHCYFVLGLGENLTQDYASAIEAWERGAAQEAPDGKSKKDHATLAARCHYWAGMANNNLGDYAAAQLSFDAAKQALPKGLTELRHEFERLRLESWYWEHCEEETSAIEAAVNRAIADARNLESKFRDPLSTICGNILLACALEAGHSAALERRLLDAACGLYAHESDRWAKFGHAQALWQRNDVPGGDRARAKKIYLGILPEVVHAITTRFEERQKILARTTSFICHCRVGDQARSSEDLNVIIAGLADIEESSCLYSQFSMRNVAKENFTPALLRDFFNKHFPVAHVPAATPPSPPAAL